MNQLQDQVDVKEFSQQGQAHLDCLLALLGQKSPPVESTLGPVCASTRALRGSASLLGLVDFQAFLGRVFQVIESAQANKISWSSRVEHILKSAATVEANYFQALRDGHLPAMVAELARMSGELDSWRRGEASKFKQPAANNPAGFIDSQHQVSQLAASGTDVDDLDDIVSSIKTLQKRWAERPAQAGVSAKLQCLSDEMAVLQTVVRGAAPTAHGVSIDATSGVRNHCEGGLRRLVDAAAQEVLEEAKEHQIRLAIRATGSLYDVDDELGGALLQILQDLWLDSMMAQSADGEASIDTIIRVEANRIVLEVRDSISRRQENYSRDEDPLGRYAGLRRLRAVIESVGGLVWVDPKKLEGCRFRVSLPLSVETTRATQVRIGAHDLVIPSSAIDCIHGFKDVAINQDQAGAFVVVDGERYPVLNLAFIQNDVSFDEAARDLVVVAGSFERRAALFASGPTQVHRGVVRHKPQKPWSGQFDFERGSLPVLDVRALIGRKSDAAPMQRGSSEERLLARDAGVLLIVNSSGADSKSLKDVLSKSARRTVFVETAVEAKKVLESQPVDLMLCDLSLPEMNAQQIAEHRRRTGRFADVPMLLLLKSVGDQSDLVTQQLGASEFIESSADGSRLLEVIKRLTDGS